VKLILVSDIHANLTALDAMLTDAEERYGNDCRTVQLGDVVDYCMRPNETMAKICAMGSRIIVNLAGNHERAVLGFDIDRFSSSRGADACRYTRSILDPKWFDYMESAMTSAPLEMKIDGHDLLFVHGDLSDPFWGGMPQPEMAREVYRNYDYVVCGHTHRPFLHEQYFPVDSPKALRGNRKTTFINPGSVGQPRNHNPASQYAVLDLETGAVHFNAVLYDIEAETAQHKGEIHPFYAERLKTGI
jgi:predicted phosphodiesterase